MGINCVDRRKIIDINYSHRNGIDFSRALGSFDLHCGPFRYYFINIKLNVACWTDLILFRLYITVYYFPVVSVL